MDDAATRLNGLMNILDAVERVFAPAVERYGLRIIEVGPEETWLVGSGYVISVSIDREGVTIQYLDPVSMRVYDPILFLIVRRGGVDRETGSAGRPIMKEVALHAKLLAEKGADILQGDRGWLGEYGWATILRVDGRFQDAVRRLFPGSRPGSVS